VVTRRSGLCKHIFRRRRLAGEGGVALKVAYLRISLARKTERDYEQACFMNASVKTRLEQNTYIVVHESRNTMSTTEPLQT
jgi:hypothetical protein